MVIEDYISNKGWRIFLYSLLILVGISLLFVGTLTIMKVSSLGVK
jgi:succinate dehydrogenase hydrophobic anchor subunit